VKRLDGTVEKVVTGLPPQDPNFAPRKCWPGGKIVTNDKLEVLLRFHERKGLPLTPELEAKKAELDGAANAEAELKAKRAAKFGGAGGKGKVVSLGGADGAVKGAAKTAAAAAKAAAAEAVVAPKAAPEVSAWYKNRPKGGVKVLGGTEGALTGSKRAAEDDASAPPAKQPAA